VNKKKNNSPPIVPFALNLTHYYKYYKNSLLTHNIYSDGTFKAFKIFFCHYSSFFYTTAQLFWNELLDHNCFFLAYILILESYENIVSIHESFQNYLCKSKKITSSLGVGHTVVIFLPNKKHK